MVRFLSSMFVEIVTECLIRYIDMVMMSLERLVVNLKSKLRSLKLKKPDYDKIEKSESMRVEIRSRKARKLVEETLKIADSPKSRTYAF
ncbi:hypothetical protein LOK49_LG01G03578 [Camellia lanceoleosa]|uniref:Uncharacterized protein n=1 Tax=Camellia lanceoleosa TaxID=1840588 RepID=A0ACC0IXZ1_9ERIC|nr:hypothetical protein LOK49_LG01G03578 [Camellia lanceoleosa]